MVGPKKIDFTPRIDILKGKKIKYPLMNCGLSKIAKTVLSKSIFNVTNQLNFFKKKSFKNINLGDHFLVKIFDLDSIFEPLYFLKLCSIFDELTFLLDFFSLTLGQKSYFLGPTKLMLMSTVYFHCFIVQKSKKVGEKN